MKIVYIFFTVLAAIMTWNFACNVFAGGMLLAPSRTQELNKDLMEAATKPNRWGYGISWPPDVTESYLNDIDETIIVDKTFTDVDKALQFALPIYEDFIRRVNSVRAVRPFLLEFPITPKTCCLAFRIRDMTKDRDQHPHVGTIVFRPVVEVVYWNPRPDLPKKGETKAVYLTPDQIPGLSRLYQNGVPRKAVTSKPIIRPLDKMEWRGKETAHYHFFEFSKKWAQQFSLIVIVSGETDKLKIIESDFSIAMVGTQRISLKEARNIAATFGRDALRFMKEDEKCIEYFKEETKEKATEIKPSPDYIGLRISFWDENIDRVVQPYIAEIRYVDGVFKYYTADELQRLVLVYEETFDEAMKFLDQVPLDKKPLPATQ
jgi:hypothetical protein